MEPQPTPKKLLDQVRDTLRLKHYSIRTACPEPAEGNRPTSAGSHAMSCFTTSATRPKWELPK